MQGHVAPNIACTVVPVQNHIAIVFLPLLFGGSEVPLVHNTRGGHSINIKCKHVSDCHGAGEAEGCNPEIVAFSRIRWFGYNGCLTAPALMKDLPPVQLNR